MPCDYTVWTPSWTGLARFASMSCVQFFSPGSRYLFCDTRWQMKRWWFSVYYRFVYNFAVFNQVFFLYRKIFILIIGFVDVMITMCSAHCICFYEFKQDQLRSTRFNSITNYWTSFRFYKIFTALYLLLFVTIFEKYTRSWTVKRWPFYRTSSGFVVFWKQCYCESC